ncbi:helix-turn-helix domain-containing protein [Curtobacterium sp. MCPF17_052]|nr:helix-turn-helix domain-containing protein [Curtobacterium sp. MCPF17_052]WIB13823.1 helix-turn-helix domain-containing protein [Curtobacterium sp. MCPF17_052]
MRADARKNHDSLVDAAAAVFAEDGADASLRVIARRADVGLATLLRNFPTRDALLEVLLRTGFTELAEHGRALMTADDPPRCAAHLGPGVRQERRRLPRRHRRDGVGDRRPGVSPACRVRRDAGVGRGAARTRAAGRGRSVRPGRRRPVHPRRRLRVDAQPGLRTRSPRARPRRAAHVARDLIAAPRVRRRHRRE